MSNEDFLLLGLFIIGILAILILMWSDARKLRHSTEPQSKPVVRYVDVNIKAWNKIKRSMREAMKTSRNSDVLQGMGIAGEEILSVEVIRLWLKPNTDMNFLLIYVGKAVISYADGGPVPMVRI